MINPDKSKSATALLLVIFNWSFSRGDRERDVRNVSEKLHMSMRTTAKCRYNAAGRLERQGKYSFFTTTVLSLGLVFIPLMQNAEVPLAFKGNVLNMMQIFLGVAVLVYSVVIGTARYDMRSSQLTECGDKLKELIRSLENSREANGGTVSSDELAKYQRHYSDIVTDVENHERSDYRFAVLEMVNDYFICGFPRMKIYLEAILLSGFSFLLPTLLMGIEVVFITDMVGATQVLTPYLNGATVELKNSAFKQ